MKVFFKPLLILLLISFVGVLLFYILETKKNSQLAPAAITDLSGTTEKKSIPFEELTIPYLRKREYKSSVAELTKRSETSSYTTYLTSYDSDGLKINSLLTQPKGEAPVNGWPAIVFVHGYIPPSLYKTTENYIAYVDYLAQNGFVVFKIDLRGHGNSEGEAGGGYYSSDYVIDTLNAYSALQSLDFVNADKIGLWGHSMAGNILLRSVAVKQDIPSIVIWGGAGFTYQDLSDFGIQDNSYRPPSDQSSSRKRRTELFAKHGQFSSVSEFWRMVVPTNYLDGVSTAIQLDHAVNDNVVSIEYSRNLDKVLDSTSLQHELNEFSSGGHNISDPSFGSAMTKTVEFFNRHLKETN